MGLIESMKELFQGSNDEIHSLRETFDTLVHDNEWGGLHGLVDQFKKKGLGDAVSSWISQGENKKITAEQIQSVLGSQKMQHLAEKFGMEPAQFNTKVAEYLPIVIDKLTPNGKLPEPAAKV